MIYEVCIRSPSWVARPGKPLLWTSVWINHSALLGHSQEWRLPLGWVSKRVVTSLAIAMDGDAVPLAQVNSHIDHTSCSWDETMLLKPKQDHIPTFISQKHTNMHKSTKKIILRGTNRHPDYFSFFLLKEKKTHERPKQKETQNTHGRSCEEWPQDLFLQLVARGGRRA